MTKKTNKHVLSYAEMEAAGTALGLGPEDFIELCAEAKYNAVLGMINAIQDSKGSIALQEDHMRQKCKDDFVGELLDKKMITEEQVASLDYKTEYEPGAFSGAPDNIFGNVFLEQVDLEPRVICRSIPYRFFSEKPALRVRIYLVEKTEHNSKSKGIDVELSSNTTIVYTRSVPIPAHLCKQYNEKLAAHFNKVSEFYLLYKDKVITLDTFLRETRNKINGTLLRQSAPNVCKQLEDFLGVSITDAS